MNIFDDDHIPEYTKGDDLCPSCGINLHVDNTSDGCNDSQGCGAFADYEDEDYDLEDDLLEELNFDD